MDEMQKIVDLFRIHSDKAFCLHISIQSRPETSVPHRWNLHKIIYSTGKNQHITNIINKLGHRLPTLMWIELHNSNICKLQNLKNKLAIHLFYATLYM